MVPTLSTILQHCAHSIKSGDPLILADGILRYGMYSTGKVAISRPIATRVPPVWPSVQKLVHFVVNYSRSPDLKSSSNFRLIEVKENSKEFSYLFYSSSYNLLFTVCFILLENCNRNLICLFVTFSYALLCWSLDSLSWALELLPEFWMASFFWSSHPPLLVSETKGKFCWSVTKISEVICDINLSLACFCFWWVDQKTLLLVQKLVSSVFWQV